MKDKDRKAQNTPKPLEQTPFDAASPVKKNLPATKQVAKRLGQVDSALEICAQAINSNDASQMEFYLGCRDALTTYRAALQKAVEPDEQKYWADKIDSTLDKIYSKDSQNKRLILGGLSIVVVGAVVISFIRKIARV